MDKETIFYSIMFQGTEAASIIPELGNAFNLTAHRINKDGEVIKIPINRTLGKLSVAGGQTWIHPVINVDSIDITFESNNTKTVRTARPVIRYCDATGCRNIVQFALHQNC